MPVSQRVAHACIPTVASYGRAQCEAEYQSPFTGVKGACVLDITCSEVAGKGDVVTWWPELWNEMNE